MRPASVVNCCTKTLFNAANLLENTIISYKCLDIFKKTYSIDHITEEYVQLLVTIIEILTKTTFLYTP